MKDHSILNSWLEHRSKEILDKIPAEDMIVLLLKTHIEQNRKTIELLKSEIDELRSSIQSIGAKTAIIQLELQPNPCNY